MAIDRRTEQGTDKSCNFACKASQFTVNRLFTGIGSQVDCRLEAKIIAVCSHAAARTRLAIRRAPRGMDQGQLESSSEEGSSLDEPSWVSWFCMLRNHEFFCEVDPAFVQDRFNLYGLKEVVGPLYGEAMTMILGYAPTGARRRAAWLTGRDERTQLHSLSAA